MNSVFLRSKDSISKIIIKYYIAMLPLVIYGFYKNGIKLYYHNLVGLYGLFKPLIFDLLGLIIGIIINIIYIKIIKKEKLKGFLFSSFNPLYGLLIASVISINTRIIFFIIVTTICLMLNHIIIKNRINIIALTSLLLIFISKLLNSFSYLNLYESNNNLSLNSLDYLIGRGYGGINTTCGLILIFSILILCSIKSYKKEIALYTSITYVIIMIIYCAYINNIGEIFNNIFANGILFNYIFIATEPLSSSYTSKGKIIYSIIVSISTFGLYLFSPALSALGGIIIGSILNKIIDHLCQR